MLKTVAEQCGAWSAIAYECVRYAGVDLDAMDRAMQSFSEQPCTAFAQMQKEMMHAIKRLPEDDRTYWRQRLTDYALRELPSRLDEEALSEFWLEYWKTRRDLNNG